MTDKFTKYALATMFAIVAALVVNAYVGVVVFGGNMETGYIKIIEGEAEQQGLTPSHVVELDEVGEYISFFIAGAAGGFLVGWLIPTISEQTRRKT